MDCSHMGLDRDAGRKAARGVSKGVGSAGCGGEKMIWFFIGLFTGVVGGVLVLSLCIAAHDEDEIYTGWDNEAKKN